VSFAKTAEPIEMPFGWKTRVCSKNHVLDGDPDPPWEGAILRERHAMRYLMTLLFCAKTAEPIEMPSGLWTWMGSRKHILDGSPDPPSEGAIFREKDMPGHARRHCRELCKNS